MGVLGQTPNSIALGASLTPDRSAETEIVKTVERLGEGK